MDDNPLVDVILCGMISWIAGPTFVPLLLVYSDVIKTHLSGELEL